MRVNSDQLLKLISVILLLVGLAYLIKGFYFLLLGDYHDVAGDLFRRWKEQRYIYQGQYPYDAMPGSPTIDPKIGPVTSGGYFPWSFFAQFLFIPPLPRPLLRVYWAGLNLIALVVVGLFAYQTGRPYGRTQAWFSLSACLAMSSYSTTLRLGQYGIIINALLIGAFWCLQNRRQSWAGLLLGLALTKLNIAGFYPFIPVVLMQLGTLRVLTGYLVVANLSIWVITQVDPVTMILRIYQQSSAFASTGTSIVSLLADLGLDPQLITVGAALAGVGTVITLFYFWRHNSLLSLFAIAAVLGRIAFYHWHYDNLMLLFLLLLLIRGMLANPQPGNIAAFSMMMLTLLLPAKVIELPHVQTLQIVAWMAALVYALWIENKGRRLFNVT